MQILDKSYKISKFYNSMGSNYNVNDRAAWNLRATEIIKSNRGKILKKILINAQKLVERHQKF